jgi:peptidoglycan/xylan/chitin deacetylase (PgdA/CDA1 family)
MGEAYSQSKRISRREFLGLSAAGAATWAFRDISFPSFCIPEDNQERVEFAWPEDIRGNEHFLGGHVYITVDDCNNHEVLSQMIDSIESVNATATFFPNSNYQPFTDNVMRLWQRIARNRHEIGYHTTNHMFGKDLLPENNWSAQQLHEDFERFTQHMRQILDDQTYTPQFVRPPYGNWNHDWMSFVRENNLVNVRWNYVPNQTHGIDYFRSVANHPNGGRIILLHTRPWDKNWLNQSMAELYEIASSSGGEIISLPRVIPQAT